MPPAATANAGRPPSVSRRATTGAFLQRGRITGHRKRAQQEGVKHQPGIVLSVTEGSQPADEEQQLP